MNDAVRQARKAQRRQRRKEQQMHGLPGGRGNGVGEPPQAKFLREQVAEAAKDPIRFAEMMSKMQGGPSPQDLVAQQNAQRVEMEKRQQVAQELQVWMGCYLERCKVVAQEKGEPSSEWIEQQLTVAATIANKAVAKAKENARL